MTTVDPREDPPTEASELETLLGFLAIVCLPRQLEWVRALGALS